MAEEENLETSPELRESLVIVDTGKFVLLPNNQNGRAELKLRQVVD